MSAGNRRVSLLLVSLMIFASWVPLATADDSPPQGDEAPVIYAYDLDGFVAEDLSLIHI